MQYYDELLIKNVGFQPEFGSSDHVVCCIPGKMANSYLANNAIEISLRYSYNGSGKTAFGGAHQWPCVRLRFEFPSHEEMLAGDFAIALKEFVEKFSKDHGLNIEDVSEKEDKDQVRNGDDQK